MSVKKTIAGLLCSALLFAAGTAGAAPLMDYAPGRAALDITWRGNADTETGNMKIKADNGLTEWGVTVGLGGRFGLQHRVLTGQSKANTDVDWGSYHTKTEFKETNLLYGLDRNTAVFAGVISTRGWLSTDIGGSGSDSKNEFQVGMVRVADLGSNLKAYGSAAAGSHTFQYELGLSYRVSERCEINLGYRDIKVSGVKWPGNFERDNRINGIGLGLTYTL